MDSERQGVGSRFKSAVKCMEGGDIEAIKTEPFHLYNLCMRFSAPLEQGELSEFSSGLGFLVLGFSTQHY